MSDSMRRTLIVAVAVAVVMVAAACSSDSPQHAAGVSSSSRVDDATDGGGGDTVTELGSGDGSQDAAGVSSSSRVDDATDGGGGDTVISDGGAAAVIDAVRAAREMAAAGLVRFGDCAAVLDWLHAEYSALVGWHGFDDHWWLSGRGVGVAADAPAAEAPAESGAAAVVEGVDFSGTNLQEAGVDEADIVKTDGRRIFTVSGGRLVVVDAADRSLIGTTAVAQGWGREMLLDGDRLLLITNSGEWRDGHETVLHSIDVSGEQPEVVWTVNIQGEYLSARSVEGTARVVMHYAPQWSFPDIAHAQVTTKEAVATNRASVLDSTIDDWLPNYSLGSADSSADTSTGSLMVPCDDVHAPSVFSGFGVITVVSVPIGGDFDPSASAAVLAPGDAVYASTGSLFVATAGWLDSDEFPDGWGGDAWRQAWQRRRTSIHRFDITGTGAAYESSGEVLGLIRDQFSLSEHDGYLRVVTTVADPWGEDSESQMRVLSTIGDVLVEVGTVGDIGHGEHVQSVRFVDDVGYVVTFRQIDPFYTIDLSDPTNPTISGELKIPGFSSYLHPIGDTLVLGVGSSQLDIAGRASGAKVSLFDVSDLAAPQQVAVWTAPGGWHDIGWDHRAFLWWAPENLAVIPVTVRNDSTGANDWSGAVVLQVSDGTITEAGRIDHIINPEEPGRTDCRHITEPDMPITDSYEWSTELEHIVFRDYRIAVLACEPGEAGMTGFECHDDSELTDEAQSLDLLQSNESISWCRPSDPNVIVRSIVINDHLWTLGFKGRGQFHGSSPARLHAHNLHTLTRVAALQP